jgi:hypothetical protein
LWYTLKEYYINKLIYSGKFTEQNQLIQLVPWLHFPLDFVDLSKHSLVLYKHEDPQATLLNTTLSLKHISNILPVMYPVDLWLYDWYVMLNVHFQVETASILNTQIHVRQSNFFQPYVCFTTITLCLTCSLVILFWHIQ